MEKLAVAFINHKGGVGKTTLAYIMTQIGLAEGINVTAVDLDPQQNLSDALDLVKDNGKWFNNNLQITNEIQESPRGDFIVVDCPPALNSATAAAIDYADITLIPVMADLFSVSNLRLVYKFAAEHEKDKEQTALVKVGFDKRSLVGMIDSVLGEMQYAIAGDVPINRLIPYNIAVGNLWESKINNKTRWPYYTLYKNLWGAYKQMLNGNFKEAWEGI